MAMVSLLVAIFSYLTVARALCHYDLQTINILAKHRHFAYRISPFLILCVDTCVAHSRCLSLTFNPDNPDCKYVTSNSILSYKELVALPNESSSSQPETHNACYGMVCAAGEDCRVSRMGFPVCIKITTSEVQAEPIGQPRCSGPPPTLLNANVSDGSLLVGSVRTYTCHHGYLDTTTEKVTAQTSCLENLTWSRVHLKCSGPWLEKQTPSSLYPFYIQLKQEELELIYVNKSIIFQVKACCASFYLGKFSATGYHNTITIGGNRNLWVRIRGCPLKTATGIISCSVHTPFWVWFEDGYISVGKGNRVDEEKIAECRKDALRVVNVSISTYKNNPGSWLFLKRTGPPPTLLNANVSDGSLLVGSVRTYTCHHGYLDTVIDRSKATTRCLEKRTWSHVYFTCSGPWLQKQTPSTPYPAYIQLTPEELELIYVNKSIIFQVKACHDANFNLGKFSANGFHDTIIIGGNRNLWVGIKRCVNVKAQDILSCSVYTAFWIRFEDGYISVGKGKRVDEEKIAECRNPSIQVVDVSISTYKNNPGSWLFLKRTS